MKQIEGFYSKILEVKKSKFVAHIFPYLNFSSYINDLRFEHPRARHFVYAYRYMNEYEQVVENLSDDREPKNSSAKPILSVLQGHNIVNTAVVVVRYFGGIKLGVGGLIRAYGGSVNDVINISSFLEYKKVYNQTILVVYSNLSQIKYNLLKYNISIINEIFEEIVKLKIEGTKESLELFTRYNGELCR